MCGISGFWNQSQQLSSDQILSIIQRMSNTLFHRGPDDGGTWVDPTVGIALGHRRLGILDLSPQGHQPMVSAYGRYVIIFNGEIYNFLELRRELEELQHSFRGSSDTEVMLAAFSQWGVKGAINRFNGMFAFALWDRQERILSLGRDRLGEKPLYYGWAGQTFLFGSELKALKAYPDFKPEINRSALTLYFRYNYIPAPYTIYQGIYKLPPACLLTLTSSAVCSEPVSYWSVKEVAEQGITASFMYSETEAVDALDSLLQDSVRLRMMADVPLGAFLSGGVDSSTIVALMQNLSRQPIKTFTIGFHEKAYNEAKNAKAVAKHLGTDHTELYVTANEAMAVIPKLPTLYDEPFSDCSQIPTFLVSQLARQSVTVSLSGDGGDELFGGYNRYLWGPKTWQKVSKMPRVLRQLAYRALISISPVLWDRGFAGMGSLLGANPIQNCSGDKLHKLAQILTVDSLDDIYKQLVSHWTEPESLVLDGVESYIPVADIKQSSSQLDFIERMMYLDTVTYLPDDILVKLDRASMGVSLESRLPYLDHRLVEFAWQIPLRLKIHNGQSKWLLRQVLYKYVPPSLIETSKMGFGVPIDSWLRSSLRDWAETLLDEQRLKKEGFLNPQLVRQKWKEHLCGERNWQYHLWNVLIFQAWLEENKYSS